MKSSLLCTCDVYIKYWLYSSIWSLVLFYKMMGVIFVAQYLRVQEKANPPDSSWLLRMWALGLVFLEMPSRQAQPYRGCCLSEFIFPSVWSGLSKDFVYITFLSFICFSPSFLSLFCFFLDQMKHLAEPKKKSLQKVLTWSISCSHLECSL